MDKISIIVPVYGDKRLVKMLYDKLIAVLSTMSVTWEIILVNDCCPYGSGEEIEKLALIDNNVKFIDLSRNFGQHIAIKAGIDNCIGDYVVVMDCDLQESPENIIKFYKKIKEGYDIVYSYREKREKETFIKKIYSKISHYLLNKMSDFPIHKNMSDFTIFNKKVADSLKSFSEQNFVFSNVLAWSGFNSTELPIIQEKRAVGNSGYNLIKGLKLFLYLLINNSNKPLIFAAICAFLMFIFSMLFVIKLVIDYFINSRPLLGWTSLMTSIFFVSSLLFAYLSILGLYIGQIASGVRRRPLYIIKKKINI